MFANNGQPRWICLSVLRVTQIPTIKLERDGQKNNSFTEQSFNSFVINEKA